MQIQTQRYLKRIGDVLVWCAAHQGDLGGVPAFNALVSTLQIQQTTIQNEATAQGQSGGSATQNVVLKSQLLDAIRHDNDSIVRGAKVIDIAQPGFSANFPAPSSSGEEAVLGAARLYLKNLDVAANLNAFLNLGMAADLKTDLALDLEHFDTYNSDKSGAVQQRIADLKRLDDAIAASSQTIDSLDAIVHFKFGGDRIALDGWNQAKRLEKARAHRETPEHLAKRAAVSAGG